MKKGLGFILILCFVFLVGCGEKKEAAYYAVPITGEETSYVDSVLGKEKYRENADGTWTYEGVTYQYCLDLTGRSPNAVKDGYFKVLTDNKSLTFEDVSKSLFSSNSVDWEIMKNSVIVEIK